MFITHFIVKRYIDLISTYRLMVASTSLPLRCARQIHGNPTHAHTLTSTRIIDWTNGGKPIRAVWCRPTFTIQLLQKFPGRKTAKFLASLPTLWVFYYTHVYRKQPACDTATSTKHKLNDTQYVKMLWPAGIHNIGIREY